MLVITLPTPIIAQKLPAFQGAPHSLTAREGFIKWHAAKDATNRGVKIEQGQNESYFNYDRVPWDIFLS